MPTQGESAGPVRVDHALIHRDTALTLRSAENKRLTCGHAPPPQSPL